MQGVGRTAVALVAITGIASAQPLPPDPRSAEDNRRSPSAGPTVPITVRPGGDILGRDIVPPLGVVPSEPPPSIEHPIDPRTYACGPGDVFELDFWGSQNLQLKLTTDLEGRAFIPRVGFIPVAGKTLAAVRTAMQSKIRAVYPGLSFDITLLSPRSFLVHVVDNVKQPGSYISRALDRVSTVIARAGIETGSRRRISIKHHDGTTGTADLVRYELTGDIAYNPFLLDGDVITVPFADPLVAITGAVRRPGKYELIATKDLAELLDLAGGFTSSVSRALPVRLIRRNPRQQQATIELPFAGAAAPNTLLQDDDLIIVRGSQELERTVLVIGAEVTPGGGGGAGAGVTEPPDPATMSRRVLVVDGDTVLSLFNRIGGVKAPGDLRRSYIARPRSGQPPELIPIDLDALLVRREFGADRPVQPGDTIVVPPMQYSVLVEGAVARAGLYNYNPAFGVSEYIARAGGRTRTARDLDETQLIDPGGRTHPFQPGMRPLPGDAILVPERSFSRAEIAQLIIAAASLVISGVAVTIAATR
ncbi:MAG TPA: SLBB domain-containing protein [Kofleriaceae bacterium]|nr:SLBB domain-containing protein [Kofleriaceae bacterium]